MPLLLDKHHTPMHWRNLTRANQRIDDDVSGTERVRVALVNNMPDAAIEDTEAQFLGLLDAASGELPVSVELFSLPGISRGEKIQEHLNAYYKSTRGLVEERFDGAIITGTEPKEADLRQESYWDALTAVFEWSEENTFSTVLSCLAAHAGVLFSDRISRHPIGFKRFGVFEHTVLQEHALTLGAPQPVRMPHSRWSELEEHALRFAGYTILTKSAEAGVDLFVKQKKQSLFVHFQGHPEYGARTLFKEYRRDVRRFLYKERETYPDLPRNYFDDNSAKQLTAFREAALSDSDERLMEHFPDGLDSLEAPWRPASLQIYRNWLNYIQNKRGKLCAEPPLAQVASSGASQGPVSNRVRFQPLQVCTR